MTALIHGGDLHVASARYDIPEADWIDLSTGINPIAYPCTTIPPEAFTQLPYLSPVFKQALRAYYGNHDYIPLSGSQEIIHKLPSLLAQLPITLPSLGYQEHHDAWKKNGENITYYDALSLSSAKETINSALKQNPAQHLLVINPNNPSGLSFAKEQLLDWASKMSKDARLIVDEAFIDLYSEKSLLSTPELPHNILVLRSIGKFFGLAGIRAGFLFASAKTLSELELPPNPWPINGVAQELLNKALVDHEWHLNNRTSIHTGAALMTELFTPLGLRLISNQGLFLSFQGPKNYLALLYETFAQAGILLRLIPVNSAHSILRVGLLDHNDESAISRVKSCIEHARKQSEPDDQL